MPEQRRHLVLGVGHAVQQAVAHFDNQPFLFGQRLHQPPHPGHGNAAHYLVLHLAGGRAQTDR